MLRPWPGASRLASLTGGGLSISNGGLLPRIPVPMPAAMPASALLHYPAYPIFSPATHLPASKRTCSPLIHFLFTTQHSSPWSQETPAPFPSHHLGGGGGGCCGRCRCRTFWPHASAGPHILCVLVYLGWSRGGIPSLSARQRPRGRDRGSFPFICVSTGGVTPRLRPRRFPSCFCLCISLGTAAP